MWDLEGTCPSHVVHEKFSVPPKKTLPIAEMKYPKSENPKPVYFLLLKLYRQSDYGILSRNFYWLHLPGGDYKLLEAYRAKKIPLEITSRVSVNGTSHQVHIYVENTSTNPNHTDELPNKNFCPSIGDGDYDDTSVLCVLDRTKNKQPARFLQRIYRHFSRESDSLRIVRTAGANIGVAFFLHFSVHALEMECREGEDTRILPVHYTDNYFSLVPGESTSINLTFDVPPGVTPHVILNGWNFQEGFTVL